MAWRAALGALCLLVVGVSEGEAVDVSRYRPRTLEDLTREYPAMRGLSISPDIAIRTKVVYTADFRDLASS